MVLQLLSHFGYFAIAVLLIGAGMGIPVPEELVQLTAGFLARHGALAFVPALAATYVGIVAGDALFFSFARSHGPRLLASKPFRRVLTPRRRELLERHFARHAFLTVMVARHTSGLRLAAYALAAVNGVKRRTFVLADALSALLSVPLVVSLGYLFAEHLDAVKKRMHDVQIAILVLVVLAVAAVIAVRWSRRAPTASARPRMPPAVKGRPADDQA